MIKCAENICERGSKRNEHIQAFCEPNTARKGLRRRKSRGKEKAKTGTKSSVRISDAVSFRLASKERALKPSSVAKYRNLASRHIVPFLGDRRIHELDREAALDFVRLLSDGKTNGGELLSRGTARDVLMILKKSVRLYGG